MDAVTLTPEQQQQQRQMVRLLAGEMADAGGAISFSRYMELALYAPGLGYYVAGASKFGVGGDFVTAPEISPLFGAALAMPCAQVLAELANAAILEFGAGTGRMAAQVLARLEAIGQLPEHYLILELSPELRQRQAETLMAQVPHLQERVTWIDRLPEGFRGVMLANEVLDAMPVQPFRRNRDRVEALWVGTQGAALAPRWQPGCGDLVKAVEKIEQVVGPLADGYISEVNLQIRPWLAALDQAMEKGVVLLIDYVHERAVYYHPQRNRGTLRCHFRHQVFDDPLQLPGLMDITAHVDFTAVAEAGEAVGLELLGYDNQANFMLGCGIDGLLSEVAQEQYLEQVQGVKRLLMPEGLGESFKVMALGKGFKGELAAFRCG
jgi:SAM-dependent MidA family methyltransferase